MTLVLQFHQLSPSLGRSVMPKNAQKCEARPTRSIANEGDDGERGLWVDYDLLRKHRRNSHTIIHDSMVATNNRYLELADVALGNKKTKKKYKAAASE